MKKTSTDGTPHQSMVCIRMRIGWAFWKFKNKLKICFSSFEILKNILHKYALKLAWTHICVRIHDPKTRREIISKKVHAVKKSKLKQLQFIINIFSIFKIFSATKKI